MAYHLNPAVSKIVSPVVLVFPDGTKQSFPSGAEASQAVFNERYQIEAIRAVDDKIEITLEPNNKCPVGDESFF